MKLREIRKSKNITLNELSENVDIAKSSLHRYETLKRFPNPEALRKIAAFYKLTDEESYEIFLDYYKKER